MVRREQVPQMAPTQAYSLQANAPYIQYLCTKALIVTGGPIVNIMIQSDKARLTTNMLVGVLRFLVFKKMKMTSPFPKKLMSQRTKKRMPKI